MNLDFWLRRLSGRATCLLGNGTRLQASARIRNIRGDNRFIRVGDNSLVAGELLVFAHGGDITIVDWCFVGEGARIWSSDNIKIGNRVLISHNVNIFDSLSHPLNPRLRHEQFKSILTSGHPRKLDLAEQPVSIDDDVWIGANASILSGVHLGEGAIIGTGSVVTRDVAAFTMVAGNPATAIRELSADER